MAAEPASKYKASPTWPAHLSVGAVLINERGEIAFHHYPESKIGSVYLLMRETLHDDESLEAAIARGLQEEFGASGTILTFLDSLRVEFGENLVGDGRRMHKTTLYFLVQLETFDPSKRDQDDPEKDSRIVWLAPAVAEPLLLEQGKRLHERPDLDEASIVAIAAKFLKKL